jgi:hypothetical protein
MMPNVDNKGGKDLANNWSVGGRTRHVEVRQYLLRKLKEQGIINCVWVAGAGAVTYYLPQQVYEKHAKIYVGNDKYMVNIQVEEGVRRETTPRWYSDVHKNYHDQDFIQEFQRSLWKVSRIRIPRIDVMEISVGV